MFGSLVVVFIGDVVQLPPVGGGGLYIDRKGDQGRDIRQLKLIEGHALFNKVKAMELRGQHRAQDAAHVAAINAFRL